MAYLLGIDVGTTGTRALLIRDDGSTVAAATSEYPLHTPYPLWAEQEPEDWWQATISAVTQVVAESDVQPGEIAGVGLSGQMHGLVLLDERGRVLRPSIIWCDSRTQAQVEAITARVGEQRLVELTCNRAMTSFTLTKMMWVREHEPEVWRQARIALLPKDYIRYRLTGAYATEVSDASGTLLLDVKARRWSQAMLDAAEIPASLLPECFESTVPSARVSPEAAQALPLAAGTPVVGGGGDQAAGGVGNGIVERGIVSATIGSSGVVFAFTDQPTLDPAGRINTMCHAVPGAWFVMGVTLGAGLSLRWLRDQVAVTEMAAGRLAGIDPYDLMSREAERAPAGSEGLIYLPYLMGERTPHVDPFARGVFFGITARHTRAHLMRSVLEGVAYSLQDSFEIFRELGIPVTEVRASGGGARSPLWRQIQAAVYGHELLTINQSEGPAFGAALLAGVGAGVYRDVPEACRATIRVVDRTPPEEQARAAYLRYYPIYRGLYPALKSSFAAVTAATLDEV